MINLAGGPGHGGGMVMERDGHDSCLTASMDSETDSAAMQASHAHGTTASSEASATSARLFDPRSAGDDTHLHAAIGQMSRGFAMFDEEQRLISCNLAFQRLYQAPDSLCRTGTSGRAFFEHAKSVGLVSRDATPEDSELARAVLRTAPWRGPVEMRNGTILDFNFEPLPGGTSILLIEDVTDLKRREAVERSLQQAAEAQAMRFKAAINNMSHGLSMYDADYRLVTCNETYARLYDLPPDLTLPGTPFADIYAHRREAGMTAKGENFNAGLRHILDVVDAGSSEKSIISMASGRVIKVNHQPLADGGWLSTHEDITEQHRDAEIINYLARHDSLTGLANRATFLEAMASAETRIEDGEIMAVFCIDLDRFKEINDSLGHAVGDAVLTGLAGQLLSVLDGRGVTARLGGDEFAALVGPLQSVEDAIDIAEALMDATALPLTVGNARVSCKASFGIALAPQHGLDANTLMRCADLALYRAKSESPGSYCLFESSLDVAQRRRQYIEHGLRSAIETNGLSLMYQPLIDLESGDVACCEALMRWQSPELGLVSPAEFIPVAEETGLIPRIGAWALENACIEATNWPSSVRVAVNVSPMQFRGDDLVEQVTWALVRSGLDPSRLELEITESLFLADDTHNLEVLHALRQLGVRFALDDFGTGYSSLAYMLRFPFDKVKIDRAIVSTIDRKPETVAMVTAIVELCRGFDMLTVAEGIETEGQLAEVKAHGVSEVQGYIFSPPLPQSAIGELLRRKHVPAGNTALPEPYVRWA